MFSLFSFRWDRTSSSLIVLYESPRAYKSPSFIAIKLASHHPWMPEYPSIKSLFLCSNQDSVLIEFNGAACEASPLLFFLFFDYLSGLLMFETTCKEYLNWWDSLYATQMGLQLQNSMSPLCFFLSGYTSYTSDSINEIMSCNQNHVMYHLVTRALLWHPSWGLVYSSTTQAIFFQARASIFKIIA